MEHSTTRKRRQCSCRSKTSRSTRSYPCATLSCLTTAKTRTVCFFVTIMMLLTCPSSSFRRYGGTTKSPFGPNKRLPLHARKKNKMALSLPHPQALLFVIPRGGSSSSNQNTNNESSSPRRSRRGSRTARPSLSSSILDQENDDNSFLNAFQEELHGSVDGYRSVVEETFQKLKRELEEEDLFHDNNDDQDELSSSSTSVSREEQLPDEEGANESDTLSKDMPEETTKKQEKRTKQKKGTGKKRRSKRKKATVKDNDDNRVKKDDTNNLISVSHIPAEQAVSKEDATREHDDMDEEEEETMESRTATAPMVAKGGYAETTTNGATEDAAVSSEFLRVGLKNLVVAISFVTLFLLTRLVINLVMRLLAQGPSKLSNHA